MFYQKLYLKIFVYIIETNNFPFLRFFRISHILVKKLNFGFSMVFFFLIKKKNIHLMKKCCSSNLQIFISYRFGFVGLAVNKTTFYKKLLHYIWSKILLCFNLTAGLFQGIYMSLKIEQINLPSNFFFQRELFYVVLI